MDEEVVEGDDAHRDEHRHAVCSRPGARAPDVSSSRGERRRGNKLRMFKQQRRVWRSRLRALVRTRAEERRAGDEGEHVCEGILGEAHLQGDGRGGGNEEEEEMRRRRRRSTCGDWRRRERRTALAVTGTT